MRTLEIRKVGPIVEVEKIELKRYNVFVGKQSSGKSTIAKIISNCTWFEKDILTRPSNPLEYFEGIYLERLVNFHNMEGYVNKDSYVKYDSDYVTILLEKGKCTISRKDGVDTYQRKKTLYIPAERNMVVYTDSIGGAGNLRSFATDWQSARDIFDERHPQSILDLGVRYYKTGENGKTMNRIKSTAKNREYDINLKSGSSGLQSVVPITTAIDFYTGSFYASGNQEKLMNSNDKYDVRQLVAHLVKERNIINVEQSRDDIMKLMEDVVGLVTTISTSFVIEEPENNLFPETQYALINYITKCINREQRHHEVTMTTHSPYVLSTLNIQLLAGKLIHDDEIASEVCKLAAEVFLETEEFGAWAVSKGGVQSIIDKQTQMISENYLDGVSDVLAGKFNELYKLYVKTLRKG